MKEKYVLRLKWTTSKARNTYGYRVCSLYHNDELQSRCNGGGYDMIGTVVGNWAAKQFSNKLLTLITIPYYGLSFHDPNFDPGKVIIDEKSIQQREKENISLGLERYQAFYRASSSIPTENHNIPLIDGGCGISSVIKIINAIGLEIERIDDDIFLVLEK